MNCLDNNLPERWWRSDAACSCGASHLTVEHEAEAHGSLAAAAAAHGRAVSTVKDGWKALGLPARPRSVASTRKPAQADDISREEILEAELKEARSLLKKQRDANIVQQRLTELLGELIPAKEPIYQPLTPAATDPTFTPHEMMLLWSDLHASELVSREQMNGINEYDWQIMLNRHDRIVKAIRSFRENRPYPVPRLQIAALGDMVTGDIHEELAETNDRTVMEAALQLGLDGAEFVESLVPEFERIDIDGVVGNHGRRKQKPQAKNAHDNFDWMVYHILKLRLAQYPSVRVTIPTAAQHPVTMCGRWTCLLFHGDGIRSSMPGVPWGGVVRRTRELERQFFPVVGPIEHFICGHFHQWNVADGGRVIVNGSVKGPDEYSIKQFGSGCEATQLLLWFHPKRGLVDISRLDLETGKAVVIPLRKR